MVIDIKMCRFDNVPWGFRLVGGSDFEFPLTVVKVTEGSIAEESGLRVGDTIVRVNDTATSPLTHEETNKLISSCGNVFYFGVYRESEDEEGRDELKQFPVEEEICCKTPESQRECTKSPQVNVHYEDTSQGEEAEKEQVSVPEREPQVKEDCMDSLENRPCSALSENTETKVVEEEIAAVLSGESEVLKEHNVMGIFPKPGVCMTSDVLRSLNEEAIKTKAEKDKENKKWSTFLQKPNRPIPKSKQQLEAERRAANAYRVKIVRSPINRERTPPPANFSDQATLAPDQAIKPIPEQSKPGDQEKNSEKEMKEEEQKEQEEEQEEEPMPADNELPDLESLKENISNSNGLSLNDNNFNGIEKFDKEKEIPSNEQQQDQEQKQEEEENGKSSPSGSLSQANEDLLEKTTIISNLEENESSTKDSCSNEMIASKVEKTEEELALERQLADVQKQLAALSSLPSTIQSTLDAVTKQLAELLPAFKLQQDLQQQQPHFPLGQQNETEPRDIYLEKIDETNEVGVNSASGANSEKRCGSIETKNSDNDLKNNESFPKREKNFDNDGDGDGVVPDTDDDINDMEVASFERQQNQQQQQQQDSMKEKDNLMEIGNEAQNLKKQKPQSVRFNL